MTSFSQMAELLPVITLFCWAGSGARREACPYSDVDGFIVLEDGATPADKQKFDDASTEVSRRLRATLNAEGGNKGFTFCEGGLNPLARSTMMGAPIIAEGLTGSARDLSGILERELTSDNQFVKHMVAGLSDFDFAFGTDATLADDFKREADLILGKNCNMRSWRPFLTHRRRMSLSKILEVTTDPVFDPPGIADTRFNIKKQFYRIPQFVTQSLAWWHDTGGVRTDGQLSRLVAAGKMSTVNSARFMTALNAPLLVRTKSHLHAGAEEENVRTAVHPGPNPDNELVLSANEEFRLRQSASAVREIKRLAVAFYATKTKAFGHRRSPFYDN